MYWGGKSGFDQIILNFKEFLGNKEQSAEIMFSFKEPFILGTEGSEFKWFSENLNSHFFGKGRFKLKGISRHVQTKKSLGTEGLWIQKNFLPKGSNQKSLGAVVLNLWEFPNQKIKTQKCLSKKIKLAGGRADLNPPKGKTKNWIGPWWTKNLNLSSFFPKMFFS